MTSNPDFDYVEHLKGLKRMQQVNNCYLKQLRERMKVLNRELEYCEIWEEEAEDIQNRMKKKIARVQKQYDTTGNPYENGKGIDSEVYNLFENSVQEAGRNLERYAAAKKHKGLLRQMNCNSDTPPDYGLLFSKNPYESLISAEADISTLIQEQGVKRKELQKYFRELPEDNKSKETSPTIKRVKFNQKIKEKDIIELD